MYLNTCGKIKNGKFLATVKLWSKIKTKLTLGHLNTHFGIF